MNHWPFVIAAYVLTFGSTLGVMTISFQLMRRAEKALKGLEKDA